MRRPARCQCHAPGRRPALRQDRALLADAGDGHGAAAAARFARERAVLVFSKTNGFRDDAQIQAANRALRRLVEARSWDVYVSENAALFNPEALAKFDVVVLNSTSGDTFLPTQRDAFRHWLEQGGGRSPCTAPAATTTTTGAGTPTPCSAPASSAIPTRRSSSSRVWSRWPNRTTRRCARCRRAGSARRSGTPSTACPAAAAPGSSRAWTRPPTNPTRSSAWATTRSCGPAASVRAGCSIPRSATRPRPMPNRCTCR
ncbi:ThuA domain-containing protein [Pseudoxanthomonas sp. NC8]|nr:ThuA domain-containing protein [Pseudoxanthomonas sp. NC8]